MFNMCPGRNVNWRAYPLLKASFHLVGFITVYLTGFCVLFYVSSTPERQLVNVMQWFKVWTQKSQMIPGMKRILEKPPTVIFFSCCVTRKTKIEEKRNIKLMKIYIGFLTLFFMRMLRTILHLSFLKVSIPGESFHKF